MKVGQYERVLEVGERMGEKTIGFASAAMAIMAESAPVIARIRYASSKPTK